MSAEVWPSRRAVPDPRGEAPPGGPRRVVLVVRAGLPPSAGNLVSAERLAAGLRRRGLVVELCTADALADRPRPGAGGVVVHALHARHAGLAALRWAAGPPVFWTFTGTDLEAPELAALGADAGRVAAVIAYHAEAARLLEAALPRVADRVVVIPPGVTVPPPHPAGGAEHRARGAEHHSPGASVAPRGASVAPRGAEHHSPEAEHRSPGASVAPPGASVAPRGPLTLLLPAGLRPVKDPDLALRAVGAVREAGLACRLLLAGPDRDDGFGEEFLRRVAQEPAATYLGEVPHAEMDALYAAADIVLNTSRSEGLSNSVLEAMAAGRAVLATDIAGNRAAIRHGVDGWLAPEADLPAAARILAADAALRAALGRAAVEAVRRRFDPEAEIEAHVRLYVASLRRDHAVCRRVAGVCPG